jgi:hypothetical protein
LAAVGRLTMQEIDMLEFILELFGIPRGGGWA